MVSWWIVPLMLTATAAARTFVVDGNVAGPGAAWSADHTVVRDGDDARDPDPDGSGMFEFADEEDLDEVRLWIDVAGESLYVAWRTVNPPYPNRTWTTFAGTVDVGTFGLLLDVDGDSSTGMRTERTNAGFPTFASPIIGADVALVLAFERRGDGPLTWRAGWWTLDGLPAPADSLTGRAHFGVTFDGGQLGPNARWTEGVWSLREVREACEPLLERPILRRGDLIGVAGLMSTPILFDYPNARNEEITNAGFFLIGWGPVDRVGDDLYTKALHDTTGALRIAGGLPIHYDAALHTFIVDGEPTRAPLAGLPFGDVSEDGKVSAYDASLILQHVVGLPIDVDLALGDVSGNGSISAYDGALVLRCTVDPSFRFPVEDGAARFASSETGTGNWRRSAKGVVLQGTGVWGAEVTLTLEGRNVGFPNVFGARMAACRREARTFHLALIGGDIPVQVRVPDGVTIVHAAVKMNEPGASPGQLPSQSTLAPPWPNPFNGRVSIRYFLQGPVEAHVRVYDLVGRPVRMLAQGYHARGWHRAEWDGCDERGRHAPSGTYLIALRVEGEYVAVQRVVLVR